MNRLGNSSAVNGNVSASNTTVSFNPETCKYTVTFDSKNIETTVTDNSSIVDQWIEEINLLYSENSTVVVGLDIEWKPHQIKHKSNKSATLQLCIDEKCLILQLLYVKNLPLSLKDFLMNPKFCFVGVEVASDIAKLSKEYGLERFLQRLGLKKLAFEVVGLNMKKPKHVCTSDWQVRMLSDEQVEYGCIDGYASYKIGHKLIMEA